MKPFRAFLFILLLFASIFSSAQSNMPMSQVQLSEKFADGLREFYSKDYKSAENTFRYVLSKNPKHDAAYYMLAKIRNQQKEYSGASYYLQEALKIDKNNIWYKVELAETYDLMNDYNNSIKLWKEISNLKPQNEQYLISLGSAYLSNQQYRDVIKTYDKIEVLVGYNEDVTAAKVELWLYLNDIKHAVGEYDKLIKEFPSETKFYVGAGDIYRTNSMVDKAIPYYQKALTINPNDPYANLAMANIYLQQGDEDKYFEVLLKAFQSQEMAPEDKLTSLKAYLTNALKKRSDAKLQSRCVRLANAFVETHPDVVEGWATMGVLKLNMGKYEEAKSSFAHAIKLDNTHFSIWEDYLFVLSKLEDYKTITECETDLSELFPSNATMMYCLGLAFQKENKPIKALEYLKQANTYSYDSRQQAQIYNVMGDAYKALGNNEEATKYWKMAQQKGLNSKDLKTKLGE